MEEKRKRKALSEEPSLAAQERLIEIMNNSPRIKSFEGTQWEIRALKPGTQWLIAQEAIAIDKAESSNFGDVIKQFAVNIPSVVKVITLALLNDRVKIFANGKDGAFSEEYESTYTTIMWDTQQGGWLNILIEVINMLDIEVFFRLPARYRYCARGCWEGRRRWKNKNSYCANRVRAMIDFLKANPYVTRDEYLWSWSVPQVQLAMFDNTHVEYLSEEQAKIEKRRKEAVRYDSAAALANDLGNAIIF